MPYLQPLDPPHSRHQFRLVHGSTARRTGQSLCDGAAHFATTMPAGGPGYSLSGFGEARRHCDLSYHRPTTSWSYVRRLRPQATSSGYVLGLRPATTSRGLRPTRLATSWGEEDELENRLKVGGTGRGDLLGDDGSHGTLMRTTVMWAGHTGLSRKLVSDPAGACIQNSFTT